MSGGVIVRGLSNTTSNIRVVRTDKYDNDPYRDKVVLHLPLHENFNDVSDYSRVHSVTGKPLIDSDGYVRKGGSCDINSSSINYSSASWMNLNQDFTIECWVKQNSVPAIYGNILLSRWKYINTKTASFSMGVHSNLIGFGASSNGSDQNFSFNLDHSFLLHKWYHVVCQRKTI